MNKLNNRGFAITTILYGVLLIFIFLLLSMLGILGSYRDNLEKLIDNTNGSRDIIQIKKNDRSSGRRLVCQNNICEYCNSNNCKEIER